MAVIRIPHERTRQPEAVEKAGRSFARFPTPVRDRKPLTIADDARRQAVAALRAYVADELDAEIGDLKASLLLDFILEELGPTIYNTGVADAQAFFGERVDDLAAVCHREEFPSAGRRR